MAGRTLPTIHRAEKKQLYGRVALCGPTGSGKTWTALTWAAILGQRTLLVDTENRSASYYAGHFTFDVADWPAPYDPRDLTEFIAQVAKAGDYDVLIVDSLSHFWEGEGGTLDIKNAAAGRSGGNDFAGWKTATPALQHLVDVMRNAPMHVIACMRSKMEYVLEQGANGKTTPRKVGMAPVMRAGVEYEFTIVGDLNLEHQLVISKSRCAELADKVAQPGRAGELAATFKDWLSSGDSADELPPIDPPTTAPAREVRPAEEWRDADIPNSEPRDSKRLTPGQKAAVDILNKIPDDDTRKRVKAEFVEAFGEPYLLKASDLRDAMAWATKQYAAIVQEDQSELEPAES
jgi:hypothetical protein